MFEKIISMFFVKKPVETGRRCRTVIGKTRKSGEKIRYALYTDKPFKKEAENLEKRLYREEVRKASEVGHDKRAHMVKTCLSSYFENVTDLKKPAASGGRAGNGILFRTALYNRQGRGISDGSCLSRDVYRNFSRD